MNKIMDICLFIAIIMNLQLLTKDTRVIDSFNINIEYIKGVLW